MKRSLFWTLKRDWERYEVMAVTSEKAGARGRYFGRDEYGNATHCRRGETYGRFADQASAKAMITTIKAVGEHYRSLIDAADAVGRQLRASRDSAIEQIIAKNYTGKVWMDDDGTLFLGENGTIPLEAASDAA